MSKKNGVQCGDCTDGWMNDGPKGCKRAGNGDGVDGCFVVPVCVVSVGFVDGRR